MSTSEFALDETHVLTTPEDLAAHYPPAYPLVVDKQVDHIDAYGRALIAASPFLVMATYGKSGLDCSPKGDAPGFVRVADPKTLLLPDRPGNNRLDGMRNILTDPQIALIFFIPGMNEIFRVNGRARISVDPRLRGQFVLNERPARAVIAVTVREAFLHCGRALLRSDLWRIGRDAARPPVSSSSDIVEAHAVLTRRARGAGAP